MAFDAEGPVFSYFFAGGKVGGGVRGEIAA